MRGRIDVLVLKQQFWLLVIESKQTGFSLLTAIPQALLTRQCKSQKGIQKFQGFQPKKCQINYCRFNSLYAG